MSLAERVEVHEAELLGPRQQGRYINAFCHLHGGDHQRSLHVNSENGFGKCHACGVQVYVPELMPDGGASYGAAQGRPWRAPSVDRLLTPRARRETLGQPEPSNWQLEEVVALQRLYERMQARLADDRALLYLLARGIPANVAAEAGAGYIPADAPVQRRKDEDGKTRRYIAGTSLPAKWRDRLIFPLSSPGGFGFYGRSLHGWELGGDVNVHATWLKDKARDLGDVIEWGRCHEKTYPAGWFNYDALATATHAVLVEGVFDALALVAGGAESGEVVALVGTAAQREWVDVVHCPYLHVGGVVLALDYDQPKTIEIADNLARELRSKAGLHVVPCRPPQDGRGKDWSERWRTMQEEGVWPVLTALDALTDMPSPASVEEANIIPFAPTEVSAESRDEIAAVNASVNASEIAEPFSMPTLAELEAEVRNDAVVRFLLERDYELVEVRAAMPYASCHGDTGRLSQ